MPLSFLLTVSCGDRYLPLHSLGKKKANASDHLFCIAQEPPLGTFHPNTRLLKLAMQPSI